MKTLSLKLDDNVYEETAQLIEKIKNREIGTSTKSYSITIDFKKER